MNNGGSTTKVCRRNYEVHTRTYITTWFSNTASGAILNRSYHSMQNQKRKKRVFFRQSKRFCAVAALLAFCRQPVELRSSTYRVYSNSSSRCTYLPPVGTKASSAKAHPCPRQHFIYSSASPPPTASYHTAAVQDPLTPRAAVKPAVAT